jgi:hypothetical protein
MAGGKIYVIAQGDSAESVAFENGHFLQTLWNHPDNAELRQLRQDPHVLYPGDRIFVPELRVKQEERPTDAKHTFVKKGVPSKLRLVVMENQRPCAGQPFILIIDGKSFEGKTNTDGSVEQAIPPNAKSGKLIVGLGPKQRVYPLQLGGLDPITVISGVQGRLRNLGLLGGAIDGQLGPATVAALELFQRQNGIPATGQPDDATRAKLQTVHGV